MNKNSLTHGFFAGKVTIKTYNAYDSIEVLRYCINRGLTHSSVRKASSVILKDIEARHYSL